MKKLLALILAVSMLFCFAACGGNFDDKSDKSDDKKDYVKFEEDDDENDKENDKKKQTIVVGYTIYEPMNYKDANGELVGFDTELAKAVFTNLGYDEVIFKEIEWSEKYTELESGSIDCIWNGFTANAADDDGIYRTEKVDFSYIYMKNLQVVVVKKGSSIASAADLEGKFGCAESGSAGEVYADEFSAAEIKGLPNQTDCLTEVNGKTCDFAVIDAQLAKACVGKGDYANLEIVEGLSSDVEYYAVAFKKGSDLTAQVNEQLIVLAKEGFVSALGEKYGLTYSVGVAVPEKVE